MRLEPLCKLTMRYDQGSLHRPYDRAGGQGEEGLGFGRGEGEVSGDIDGVLVWANYPRRREDGVWTPNLRGVISMRKDEEVLIAVHGQSVQENAPGNQRAILARVELTTEDESYRWLNTCFVIGEGEIATSGNSGGYSLTCA
jgi:hypothetical protein